MGIVKSFKEFVNEKTELPEISDENKELLRQFFDFLLEANKRPKAKYHLAINTNNDPVWNGEIDERYRHIWDNFVDQLKQLTGIIPMRVIEEVVDKDGNCIDPNFRNILVDLDEDYIAEFDEDELTFRIPAESFIDEDGAKFIQDELLEVTVEGYEPKHTYEEDDFPFDNYPYEEGKIKKFSKFVNENKKQKSED